LWIVKLALDRPYTFIILALLIMIMSPVVILRTPTDIFPNINIPVVAVAWQYTGLNRIDFLQRRRGRQGFPSARRQSRHGKRADHSRIAVYAAPASARDTPP